MNPLQGSFLTLSFALFLTTPTLFAATSSAVKSPADLNTSASTNLSTRQEALRENSTINEKAYRKTIHASEAQGANVESFLKLEDPSLELRDRPWLWTFAFKVQTLKPAGTGTVARNTFDFSTYGQAVMPSIELGILFDLVQGSSVSWSSGLAAHAGASTQTTELAGSNGYIYDQARLNTTILSGIWNNRFKTSSLKNVSFLLNPEMGVINYAQSATGTDLANLSQQNNFWGVGLGVEYAFNKKWGIVAEYKNRKAAVADIAKADIQPQSFEIGTSVVW